MVKTWTIVSSKKSEIESNILIKNKEITIMLKRAYWNLIVPFYLIQSAIIKVKIRFEDKIWANNLNK